MSGRIVRFAADENDLGEAGRVLAEIDPTPYRDQVELARAKLAKAKGDRGKIEVARKTLEAAGASVGKAEKSVDGAVTGNEQIAEAEQLTEVKRQTAEEARRGLAAAEDTLGYTRIRAPFPGVVVRRARNLGDFASPGVAVLSLYNPDLLDVTANLEETRLRGVSPGNNVRPDVGAFGEPFRGRVVWVNKSTGAQFSLMPRNVVSGEFTKVVQRVPVRIAIERDHRWEQLRAGLSVRVAIGHGPGDPARTRSPGSTANHVGRPLAGGRRVERRRAPSRQRGAPPRDVDPERPLGHRAPRVVRRRPGEPDRLGDPVGPGLRAADPAEREPGAGLEPVPVRQEHGGGVDRGDAVGRVDDRHGHGGGLPFGGGRPGPGGPRSCKGPSGPPGRRG